MKWIIVFYQKWVSAPDGKNFFFGLTTGQKITKEIESMSRFHSTKVDCERDLNQLKGNKNLKESTHLMERNHS